MKLIFVIIFIIIIAACSTRPRPQTQYTFESVVADSNDYVYVALNLGSENEGDIIALFEAMNSEGIVSNISATSLDTTAITVRGTEFTEAHDLATAIVTRNQLSVRLFKSSISQEFTIPPLLEIWIGGMKVREEGFKLYLEDQ